MQSDDLGLRGLVENLFGHLGGEEGSEGLVYLGLLDSLNRSFLRPVEELQLIVCGHSDGLPEGFFVQRLEDTTIIVSEHASILH